jgi:small subunit ribosomal protein S6e
MKLIIAFPLTGCQKILDIDETEDEARLRPFYDKRISHEVNADFLGDDWKGYVLRITGGADRQGFPMKQGVLTNGRVRLLMGGKTSGFHERRKGERLRKSVRGCIVGADLASIHLVIVKKGEKDINGLTAESDAKPRRLAPKRASGIRKLYNLTKDDDVRKFVVRRTFTNKAGKSVTKAPAIQRLVTPMRLQRKRADLAEERKRLEKSREAAKTYMSLVSKLHKEVSDARTRRKSSRRESVKA